jgi:HEAT repeat protein
MLESLYHSSDEMVRQTVVHALGEVGKNHFEDIRELLEKAFSDSHHSVLNAVTGALKQLGEKNPIQTLAFVKKHLQHCNSKVRVKLLHGLELRGRTHPEDVLPILAEYQNDSGKKVIETIIHILGQISYKKGCLETVIRTLKAWENTNLTNKALKEIINVHRNYSKFSFLSHEEAQELISKEFDIA